jgi:hypothetical protein
MDGMRGACVLWLRVATHLLGVGDGSQGIKRDEIDFGASTSGGAEREKGTGGAERDWW